MCLHGFKNSARFAFYVHCNAHCLNLVLADAVKSVPEAVSFCSPAEALELCIWLVRSSQVACSSERAVSTAAARGTTETYGCKVCMQIHGMP